MLDPGEFCGKESRLKAAESLFLSHDRLKAPSSRPPQDHSSKQSSCTYVFGSFYLDPTEHRLVRDGQDLRLAPKVFETLVLLVENRGLLVDKDELMKRLWPDTFVEEVTLARNISLLRKALGDAPGQDQSQYIETIPKRGYRFIAEVEEILSSRTETTKNVERPKSIRGAWIAVLALVVVLAGGATIWRLSRNPGPLLHSLAVLPLENLSTDSGQEYFADGMTDEMITDLAQIHSLRVISRTSVMQFKHTKKSLREIATALGVDAIIEGSVSRSGTIVHITAQLIDVRQDRHLWAASYDCQIAHLSSLQNEVAKAIADQVRAKLTPEEDARLSNRSPQNPEAYDLMLRGEFLRSRMDRDAERQKKAISLFEQAVAIDPNNARAWAGIGQCYAALGGDFGTEDPKVMRPKARAAIAKALELNPELPEAYIASGWLKMFDWDKQGAEGDFRRAIELSPNNSEAHRRYAFFLRDRRRFDEAIKEDRLAIDLAPLDIMPQILLSLIYEDAGLLDKEIEQVRRVLELDPNYKTAYLRLGNVYAKKGQWADAISSYEKVKQTDPLGYLAGVAWTWAMSGDKAEAKRAKSELLEFSKHNHVSPYYFANYEARFGDREAAFKWLEKAYEERDPGIVDLDQEDNFAQMRSDPRFQKLQRLVAHDWEKRSSPVP